MGRTRADACWENKPGQGREMEMCESKLSRNKDAGAINSCLIIWSPKIIEVALPDLKPKVKNERLSLHKKLRRSFM